MIETEGNKGSAFTHHEWKYHIKCNRYVVCCDIVPCHFWSVAKAVLRICCGTWNLNLEIYLSFSFMMRKSGAFIFFSFNHDMLAFFQFSKQMVFNLYFHSVFEKNKNKTSVLKLKLNVLIWFDLIYSSEYAFLLQTIKVERIAFYPPLEGYKKWLPDPKI